jgi:hypothetical protein
MLEKCEKFPSMYKKYCSHCNPPEVPVRQWTAPKTYLQSLLNSRLPKERFDMLSNDFHEFVKRCALDKNFLLTFSASDSITEQEREEYKRRSGKDLPEKRLVENRVADDTQGCKRNTVISPQTVEGLSFSGVDFKPFFGGENLVAYGDRLGLWWSLIDEGFVIGGYDEQGQIRGKLA